MLKIIHVVSNSYALIGWLVGVFMVFNTTFNNI
jgi:hypothetical protein